MRFRNLALAIISILLFHPATPAQQRVAALDRNDPELRAILSEIESDIEKGRIEEKIAGLSVAIVYDQDVLLSKGFGFANLDKKGPADSATVYRVGSITKLFTALMLMQLRDAGKLSLDDPIEKYLPELKSSRGSPMPGPPRFGRWWLTTPVCQSSLRWLSNMKTRKSSRRWKSS